MKRRMIRAVLMAAAMLGVPGCGSEVDPGGVTASSSGGVDPCAPPPPDYSMCSGSTFFPDGSCAEGKCVTGELPMRVFAEWKAQVLAASGLDEAALWNRVQISDVIFTDGPSSVRVRIEYVIVMDWARSRGADSVDFGAYPLPSPPTDAEITQEMKLSLHPTWWQALGAMTSVAPPSKVGAAFSACHCGVNVDWCHIRFRNGDTAVFGVDGIGVVDQSMNQCVDALVNVATGASTQCGPTPCGIN